MVAKAMRLGEKMIHVRSSDPVFDSEDDRKGEYVVFLNLSHGVASNQVTVIGYRWRHQTSLDSRCKQFGIVVDAAVAFFHRNIRED